MFPLVYGNKLLVMFIKHLFFIGIQLIVALVKMHLFFLLTYVPERKVNIPGLEMVKLRNAAILSLDICG